MSQSDRPSAPRTARDARSVCLVEVRNATGDRMIAPSVEVADTPRARRKGLLSRAPLRPGEGLWIAPCEAVHTFGMSYPIDLVYVDKRRRVVKLVESVPPARISISLRAHSVIELAPGSIRESSTCLGDSLEFSPSRPDTADLSG